MKETAAESQRLATDSTLLSSLARKQAVASHNLLKADVVADGEDFERKRAWDWTIDEAAKWDKRMEKKERHRQGVAFQDFHQESRKVYKRQLRELKPDLERYEKEKMTAVQRAATSGKLEIVEMNGDSGELVAVDQSGTFYTSADSTDFVENRPDRAAVDRLVGDLRKAEETRLRKRRTAKGRGDDEPDVTYINDKVRFLSRLTSLAPTDNHLHPSRNLLFVLFILFVLRLLCVSRPSNHADAFFSGKRIQNKEFNQKLARFYNKVGLRSISIPFDEGQELSQTVKLLALYSCACLNYGVANAWRSFLGSSIPPISETVSSEERPFDLFPEVVLLGLGVEVDGDTGGGAGAGGGGDTDGSANAEARAGADTSRSFLGSTRAPSNNDCVSSDKKAISFGADETILVYLVLPHPGTVTA